MTFVITASSQKEVWKLKIHVESLHEKKKTFKCDIWVAQKGNLKKYLEVVHEERNHSSDICYSKCFPRHKIKCILHQFMWKRNHSNVTFLNTASPKQVVGWKYI